MIARPSPRKLESYLTARTLLSEPAYVALSADSSLPISRVIMKATDSAYCHAMLIGRGSSDELLLTESTTPCAQVNSLSARIEAQSGLIDIFRIRAAVDLASAWDWSLRCAGNPYSYLNDGLIWLDRYMGGEVKPIPNSDDPWGCRRDCSCQVHAALRIDGLPVIWPADWPYDCMVAPCDLCEVAPPELFEYVCTPTWP